MLKNYIYYDKIVLQIYIHYYLNNLHKFQITIYLYYLYYNILIIILDLLSLRNLQSFAYHLNNSIIVFLSLSGIKFAILANEVFIIYFTLFTDIFSFSAISLIDNSYG